MSWWLKEQRQAFESSIRGVSDPIVPCANETRPRIPSIESIADRDPALVRMGDAFSLEMARICATDKFHKYGYQDVYAKSLEHLRHTDATVLEIGIGVNDPSRPSGMPDSHVPGASLLGWKKYLKAKEVHGADIDRRVLIDTPDYRTHYVDQRDVESLKRLASTVGGPIDVIIDDGLHTPEANAKAIAGLLPMLSPHGVMVIEDILPQYETLWRSIGDQINPNYQAVFYPGTILRSDDQSGMVVIWRTCPNS